MSLLWPAFEDGGFSLIVDGSAQVGETEMVIRPVSGVLHRSLGTGGADHSGSECKPVLTQDPG